MKLSPPVRAPTHRIILNFPPELARRIKMIARQERRTLTGQIQVLVEHALKDLPRD